MDAPYILGIESAIDGGSLAFFQGELELASLEGEPGISRAEDLLPNIAELLNVHKLSTPDLSTVVVSVGPGSFTGIRVGIATVLGLRSAWDIRCIGLTALEAIAFTSVKPNIATAVPMGRDLLCFQEFNDRLPVAGPTLVTRDQLAYELSRLRDVAILCHSDAFQVVRSVAEADSLVEDIGRNLASLLCRSAESPLANRLLKPLFVDRRAFTKI